MLDMKLYKSSLVSQAPLAHCLHIKPTSSWRPLCTNSMHHPSVHMAWPQAQACRIKNLCSTASSQKQHLQTFQRKLLEAGCSIPNSRPRRPLQHTTPLRYIVLPYTCGEESFASPCPWPHPCQVGCYRSVLWPLASENRYILEA